MLGGIAIAIALVVIMPIGLFVAGMIWSAIFGFFSTNEAEERFGEDSEYVKYRSW